jgi:hypothetical protein
VLYCSFTEKKKKKKTGLVPGGTEHPKPSKSLDGCPPFIVQQGRGALFLQECAYCTLYYVGIEYSDILRFQTQGFFPDLMILIFATSRPRSYLARELIFPFFYFQQLSDFTLPHWNTKTFGPDRNAIRTPLRVAFVDYLFGWLDETLLSLHCAQPVACGKAKLLYYLNLWKPPGAVLEFT